jgi:hypothetical protein
MSKKELSFSKNDRDGFQVEWRGVLLTLRPNDHHGLSGSIAEKDDDKISLLEFHGTSSEMPFPAHFHESGMEIEEEPEKSPIVQAYEAITEIRLAIPEDGSSASVYQHDSLLDIQDMLWRMMTVEEQAGLDKEKPNDGGRSGR